MPSPLRVATFNVENLLSRAKILSFQNRRAGDQLLAKVETLRRELRRRIYRKKQILELYADLKEYIQIVEVRDKLLDRYKRTVVADGVADWGGYIDFKHATFAESERGNTARVIRAVNADICCLIEVESRPVLKHFCIDRLPKRATFKDYSHHMLIDGNDTRGIDVAVASRLPIRTLRSHIDDRDDAGTIFSRDCLEFEVVHPSGSIWFLLNHFKSRGYGTQAANDAKRRRQARRVAEILARYDLRRDWVIVAGDLNDSPNSTSLQPLMAIPSLYDVLALQFPDAADRWTYRYRKNEQIDYLLVSEPLREAFTKAGVERRGIYNVHTFTAGAIQAFASVTSPKDAASDHGAVWAEFSL